MSFSRGRGRFRGGSPFFSTRGYRGSRKHDDDEKHDEGGIPGKQILVRRFNDRAESPGFALDQSQSSFPELTARSISIATKEPLPSPTSISRKAADPKTAADSAKRISPLSGEVMTDAVKLIYDIADHKADFSEQITEYLSSTNLAYSTIGAFGLQGVGKSTLLSMISGNNSQDLYRQYSFRPGSREATESSRYQTSNVQIFVSKMRHILIDSPPLNSGSLLDEAYGFPQSNDNKRHKSAKDIVHAKFCESAKILAFLMHVCHVIVLNVDWFIDVQLIKVLRVAELLRANLAQVSSAADIPKLDPTRKVTLIVVHARAKSIDCTPNLIAERCAFLRKIFAGSTRVQIPEADSDAYFCTPEIKPRKFSAAEQFLEDDFDEVITGLRLTLTRLGLATFTKDGTSLTEKQWLAMSRNVWHNELFEKATSLLEMSS